MSPIPNAVEREIVRRAQLDHACPRCGAYPGTRCFTLHRDGARAPVGRDAPHPERVRAAWVAYLSGVRR